MMLHFLIHYVGDIHQPLHGASMVSSRFPKGDKGGNDFKIKHKDGDLHTLWDKAVDFMPNIRAPLNDNNFDILSTIANKLLN